MRFFSLFTGVGGFEIGIDKVFTNSKCLGFSEIDKHASAVLKYRFPNVRNYGDIKTIDWSAVPDFDLLVGGSPCQDLSIAGKRAGLEGGRSGLFYEYLRALEEKKPRHFIWENVKGALSSNGGRDFAAILLAFSEAGYSLTWQVLNAKDFGVPQNRERVFVVGTRGEAGREIFFERGNDQVHSQSDTSEKEMDDVASTQTARQYASWGGNYLSQTDRLVTGETSPALQASVGGRHQPMIPDKSRIRRLTPKECESLMSWPDDWTRYGDYGNGPKEISDTQRYKMCGNGVVSKVVEEIVRAYFL